MKERMIPSECPYCGHSFQIKRDTLVIAGMNPTIDKRLEEGTYFTHLCSHCHKLYYLEQPFMYRDPKRKYMLILSNLTHFDNLPDDEQVIHCHTAKQFLFCFRVLSRDLNLKLVLKKQKQLEDKLQKPVEFSTYEAGCLWFGSIAVRLNEEENHAILKMSHRER